MPVTVRYVRPRGDALARMAAAKAAGAGAIADKLLENSQPLVPVETETLKKSGHVVELEGGKRAVVYDAVSEEDGYPYGIKQHEDATLHHPNGGEDHFLSKPMEGHDGEYLAEAAEAMRPLL
ncbi:MAG TPA: hypothetical protein VHZ96_26190 [Frankiaceae bacterium]|jgi:hypothetical protein|nr:hypothetical protein [Frankiaceae bacterium]